MSEQRYQIRSVTVYWKDMGIDITDSQSCAIASKRWLEIQEWLDEHCERVYRTHRNGIWFLEPQDAMLFKLTWAGMIV